MAISQHDKLLEMTINLIVKPNKLLLNGSLMYWLTHFLYSLSKDNPDLCMKLKDVEDLDNFIQQGLSELSETNVHI